MYGYADLDQGSFGTHAVWHSDFLFKIPAGLDRASAAPLMCGGATVFNALQSFGVKSTDRIGVIGIGGLGHLAIQYANKMGCDVVVFSSTESKKEEAMSLGASEFFATKDVKELKIGKPLDALFVTTSQQPDWAQYMPIMAPGSTVFPLTVSDGNLTIPYMPFLAGELRIQGALVAARDVHRTMLEFSARHGIKPIIERFPMSVKGVEDSMEKLRQGKMRYRGVLVAEGEN
jgi:D-arabinose 1-dehydrogenase-like Zn-dependent alcohol dehydrogenase